MQGGFGEQNKFPSVPQLRALLERVKAAPGQYPAYESFLLLTLKQMLSLGLYDHLGGGFFRYTVDPGWIVPHFEKMLYDNAQLAELYLDSGEFFKDRQLTLTGLNTLDYLLNDFRLGNYAYLASTSALDGKGIEGGYYLWDEEQVKSVLTADEWNLVGKYWGLADSTELEQLHHLYITTPAKDLNAADNALLESARKKLKRLRDERTLPVDKKIITSWNAMVLAALVKGAQYTARTDYANAATKLKIYIDQNLYTSGTLLRARFEDQLLGVASLEDYAYYAYALLQFYKWQPDKEVLTQLNNLLAEAWTRFYSTSGWTLNEKPLLQFSRYQAVIADSALYSPSALLMQVTHDFLQVKTDSKLEALLKVALKQGQDVIYESPFWYATQVNVLAK